MLFKKNVVIPEYYEFFNSVKIKKFIIFRYYNIF